MEDRMSQLKEEQSVNISENESENEVGNGYEADSFVVEDETESDYEEENFGRKSKPKKSKGEKKKKTKLVQDIQEDMDAIENAKMTRGLRKIKMTKKEQDQL